MQNAAETGQVSGGGAGKAAGTLGRVGARARWARIPCRPSPGAEKFCTPCVRPHAPIHARNFPHGAIFRRPGRAGRCSQKWRYPAAALPGSYVRGRGHTGTRRRMRAGGLAPPPARKSFREGHARPHAPSYAKKFPPSGCGASAGDGSSGIRRAQQAAEGPGGAGEAAGDCLTPVPSLPSRGARKAPQRLPGLPLRGGGTHCREGL